MMRRQPHTDAGQDLPRGASFGELLRALRLASGMSQEALASASGVSARTISDLERGVRTTPQGKPAALIADALNLDPGSRERYFDAIRQRRLPRGAAAARITPLLPALPGEILGRADEIDLVERWFAGGDRIVSLVGPGGVGKTRLALEIAARRERREPGSVIWIALDLVSSPAGVLPAIARACGVRDRGSGNLPGRIAEALAGREVLLALDNAEHVLDAMAVLPEVLAGAPGAAALVTTREDLRVSSERIIRINPLPLPVRGASRAMLAANPAVALYLDRIGVADAATDENAMAIDEAAAVVRLLDGLPLAIELAAAQALTLPRSVLPGLLEAAGIDALARGRRDGPGRFRTMEAAIAWSTDLLPPGAEHLLRLLGVFRGGFTADAVLAVAASVGSPEAIAALPALANAHLVLPDAGSATPRFRVLEPVRLFARSRLRDAGEDTRAAEAHARWFLAWGRQLGVAVDGPDPLPALAEAESDLPNLRAAIAWAIAHGDPGSAIETMVALRRFFDVRCYPGEFRSLIDSAIDAVGPDAPPSRPLMDALFWAAVFANMQGDTAASGGQIARLRALAAAAGSAEHAVRADLTEWGRASSSVETRDEAGAYLRRALAILETDAVGATGDTCDTGDTVWMVSLLLGVDLQESGDAAGAIQLLERAAASAAERGCALDQPLPLARLGLALLDLGREEEARRCMEDSLAMSVRLDAEVIALFSLLGLARLDASADALGRDDDHHASAALAARRFGAADAIVTRQALSYGPYWEEVVAGIRSRLAAALGLERLADLAREGGEGTLADALGLP